MRFHDHVSLAVAWVEMASEAEMTRVFPDPEAAAMPPFGSLCHVRTLVHESLAEDEEIIFERHNHEESHSHGL
jgi:prolyl-tRNA editing enzyme YbaK/EbsC (Cys-tRNA(Pro) deacylase)